MRVNLNDRRRGGVQAIQGRNSKKGLVGSRGLNGELSIAERGVVGSSCHCLAFDLMRSLPVKRSAALGERADGVNCRRQGPKVAFDLLCIASPVLDMILAQKCQRTKSV
ncbi:hypothetical protein KQX54_011668 [Cotesia glomerata]|uniref:Uncharacterized protein n=1 Tax=Cotesia glomerata TaxID=32391 RepID=A0AAV7J0S9_COTGL|nr:hypothetical protein KQX54_011668 [Cotesia glomerata]